MIAPALIAEVAGALTQSEDIGRLRSRFPNLHFTACSEDDVSPRYRAVEESDQHALYLITGASGHCLELTNDPAIATGILIAAKVDDQ